MRPEILFPLFAPVATLKGVGAGVERLLARLDVARVVDLLFHCPVGQVERLPLATLADAPLDTPVIVPLTVCEHRLGQGRRPSRVIAADDEHRLVTLTFFSDPGGMIGKKLPIGARRRVSGVLERYAGQLQMVHPDHIADEDAAIPLREAVYSLTEGLTNARLRSLVAVALARVPDLPEWHDPALLAQRSWPDWRAALAARHAAPADNAARQRLAYDELLASQLALVLVRSRARATGGRALPPGARASAFAASLPFTLTPAQQRCIAEIGADLAADKPMLRLLQGDVGAGKTVVALAAACQAIDAGSQVAFLAPTEILARQHFATLETLCRPLGIRIALLTGRDRKAERAATQAAVAGGEVDLIVGTHALFQDAIEYRALGLVVIDEQHRFGVAQRLALTAKAAWTPHLLAMTATPIPRTLTLALYGDMDVSRLDTRPPGRQSIDTRVVPLERLDDVYDGLARALASGAQAFWVCPLVDESEKTDLAAAEARAEALRQRFGAQVGLVHGKLSGPSKDAAMAAFVAGETRILVATTVIEVGVDVPAATLMVIEQAERFGLAQLHQLRGRVGRGSQASVCLLLRGSQLSEAARARLKLMRETDDGFRIAEEDLRLRGSGELLGTRQSGLPQFRLADLALDGDLLAMARDDARLTVTRDPQLRTPRGQALRVLLYLMERDSAVPLLRSG